MEENMVAIAEDLVLDFSGLFEGETTGEQAAETTAETILVDEEKIIQEKEKNSEGLTESLERQQAKKLYLDNKREQEDHQRSLEVYRVYQENVKTSAQLQTEILKGISAGEDIYILFLKAAKAISLMTSTTPFYSQIEADIEAIYGRGLRHKSPLQKELQEAQTRLKRLLEAEQREQHEDSRERIHRAIEAHRKLITELEAMIAQTYQ